MQKVQFSIGKRRFLQVWSSAEDQLGSHMDSKIGLEGGQEALGGQFEGARGVQVALGGQFGRANGLKVTLGGQFGLANGI